MVVYVVQVDDEFKKLWRSIPVDAMDDAKIEEYLEKQGMNKFSFKIVYITRGLKSSYAFT